MRNVVPFDSFIMICFLWEAEPDMAIGPIAGKVIWDENVKILMI